MSFIETLKNHLARLWQRICCSLFLPAAYFLSRNRGARGPLQLNFLVEEFFHEELRGFGGYGKAVQNVCGYLNRRENGRSARVLVSNRPSVTAPLAKRYHDTDVLLLPPLRRADLGSFVKCFRLASTAARKLFVTIDYCTSYDFPLLSLPGVPAVVWFHAPVDEKTCRKLAGVPLELAARQARDLADVTRAAESRKASFRRFLAVSRALPRKVAFAVLDASLEERARAAYGLPSSRIHVLPLPVPLPAPEAVPEPEKPALCFLGRLDPVKRPWIVLELARRFRQVDFLLAGATGFPELMNPVLARYRDLPNVKWLGLVDGAEKHALLSRSWGLLNTSVSESWPVSFLEAFSYGRCVVSCQNPGGLTERFGLFTGEISGEGTDARSLGLFSEKIERLLSDRAEMRERGREARKYAEENCSFENFGRRLQGLLDAEGIS